MKELTSLIQKWAAVRGLNGLDPTRQMLKLIEEVGELASGLAKQKNSEIIDSIGDIYVVLVILAMQLNLDLESCVVSAYNEIKDRKGKVVDGIFVKDETYKNFLKQGDMDGEK
jgi:NTP pyrophosphatase (non-canonical NTP hydrolase)